MNKIKYYRYLPIYKKEDIYEIVNVGVDKEASDKRHRDRLFDALTEVICHIVNNTDSPAIKQILLDYSVCLVEDDKNGSRKISASFPEKRFY